MKTGMQMLSSKSKKVINVQSLEDLTQYTYTVWERANVKVFDTGGLKHSRWGLTFNICAIVKKKCCISWSKYPQGICHGNSDSVHGRVTMPPVLVLGLAI